MEKIIQQASRRVVLGDLRFLVIDQIRRLIALEKQSAELAANPDFVSREKAQLIYRQSVEDAMTELNDFVNLTLASYPSLTTRLMEALSLAKRAKTTADGIGMLTLINEVNYFFNQQAPEDNQSSVTMSGDSDGVTFTIGGDIPKPLSEAVQTEIEAALVESRRVQIFLAAVSEVISQARLAGRKLSGSEQFARAAAFQLLESGATMPPAYHGIGVYGFRAYQTNLSLADPGEGHNQVTCLDARLIAGTIVHVEHIDRGKELDREVVEAYRLPAPLNSARVRLQIGTAAACTAYIGRPPFENGSHPDIATYVPMARVFEEDLLKAAHMTASACNAMFANGIADCKIAMERMSVTQQIRFMKAVAGNVSRDRSRQYLSVAFNLNQPLLEDRQEGNKRWIGDKFDIALIAIEVAFAGGFDKVAWDGASNLDTSEAIILSFKDSQWLELIHRAHEVGLETYVSAGMDKSHMPACVYSGVDGVGIGTKLHYRKKDASGNNIMGELKQDAILEVLAVRDKEATTARGRGASVLAMLDRLYFEQILPEDCNVLRNSLFKTLSNTDSTPENIETILSVLNGLPFWRAMTEHKESSQQLHPVVAQAKRKLISVKFTTRVSTYHEDDQTHSLLLQAISRSDITDIMEILR